MKRIAILTMAALLLTGCAAQTTDADDETALPETTVTESASPTAAPEAPTAETEADPAETTEADAEMEAMEEEMQAGGSTASPSPTATTSPSPSPTQTASPTPTASPSPTPTETAEPGFTLAEVSTRNTASECWVAISGNVYDLTRWIAQHPGGSSAITQLCGTDGTRAFTSQHGGQSNPTSTLAGYLIGPLR